MTASGQAPDGARDLRALVVAKAPVAGLAKTRLAAEVGDVAAARLAAAGLLDTLDACERAFGADRVLVALTGDLDAAEEAATLRERLAAYPEGAVFEQCAGGFDVRLAHAHGCLAERAPGSAVVQVGMDTPQLTGELLASVGRDLDGADAVLGPAVDGGWWVLALRDPAAARVLAGVPMSTDRTGADTRSALEDAGLAVAEAPVLRDVDEVPDAAAVAEEAPGSRFARCWTGALAGRRAEAHATIDGASPRAGAPR